MLKHLTTYRRELHQIPELDFNLPKTKEYIYKQLSKLPCQLFEPIPHSVIAYFDAGKAYSIAFRSDMDALPIQEMTNTKYQSKHMGIMHACGHDGHMAMLLEFAYQLSKYYKTLNHNVVLIFQPGEESSGGARKICESGIFEKFHIQKIYGIHLWPMLKEGEIATKKGSFMARTSEIHINIYGKSTHIASYEKGVDAMDIGMNYVRDLYQMIHQEYPKQALLRFGFFQSGTACNVVSNHTQIKGSLRTFDDEIHINIRNKMEELKDHYSKQGAHIQIQMTEGYPAVINDSNLVDQVRKQISNISEIKDPLWIAEDFSFYQKKVPSVFFFLGTGTKIALHTNIFDFDDKILIQGVLLYMRLSKMR